MRSIVFYFLLFSLFSRVSFAKDSETVNMLFIGNSFTFRHDLPQLVKTVVEEGTGMNVYAEYQTFGGRSMFQHYRHHLAHTFIEQTNLTDADIDNRIDTLNKRKALTKAHPEYDEWMSFYTDVRGQTSKGVSDWENKRVNNINKSIKRHEALKGSARRRWDYVVLQSWQDEVLAADKTNIEGNMAGGYAKYAREMARIAKEQGAKVILYVTAPDQQNATPVDGPLEATNTNNEEKTIVKLAKELDVYGVVFVPRAINMIQEGGTDLTFRYVNDFHPNQRSAYLVSNMFYAALFGESPLGFNYNTVTETRPGTTDPDGGPLTVVFEGEEKNQLQQAAFNAVMKFMQLW